MRVIVITSGSHGDVHPYIAIARALQARGHRVRFLVHPHFHQSVLAAGLEPVALNPSFDLESVIRHPDLMHRRRGGRLIMELVFSGLPEAHATLDHQIADFAPDAILAHQICIGARWLCERRGVPLATATLSPLFWFSRRTPIACMQRYPGRLHHLIARALLRCGLPFARFMTDRRINSIRAVLKYPPERRCMERDFLGGDLNLGMWSPLLRGPQPDDPPHGHICGFPWYDGSAAAPSLDPGIEDFLSLGKPPIAFCLGTAASHSAGDFHRLAAQAATRINRRAILLVGRGVAPPEDLPRNVMAAPYAPFSLLLHRCAAIVHHGGIGSTAQALRSGRPSLVIPHAHDQFNNALLTHELGVSRILPRHRVTVARLERELSALLSEPNYSCAAAALAPRIGAEDGAAVAADLLERLVSSRRPAPITEREPETVPARR